ncbi:MAG: transglycosylase SLT domain-containing protein [Bdellovibrionales bacterium]|nr:transglycosylase SLT domain-containing protein [Bdellovibrionales bacterium]
MSSIVDKIDKNSDWFLQGPQVNELRQAYVKALLHLLGKQLKSNRRQAWNTIDRIMQKKSWLDQAAQAQLYRSAGDLAFIQQNLSAAADYFGRSYRALPQPEMRQRIESLRGVLSKSDSKVTVAQQGPATNSDLTVEVSQEETELQQRIGVALSGGDFLAAVEDCVKLIKKFPGGRRSDWASDKIIEVLTSVISNSDTKLRLLKERILDQLDKVDGGRQAEWAKNLFGRGYYLESLRLADSSLSEMKGKSTATPLYVLAQSSFFLGNYKKAEQSFEKLIQEHGGTDIAAEALFRLGLTHLRQQKYPAGVASFERLLALPKGKQWELQARYWLYRSLQKFNSERATQEAKILIDRFPLTYYGLRTKIETNENRLSFEPDSKGPVKIQLWLSEVEYQAWERFQVLLQAGWFKEAQAELGLLPAPQSPEEKVVRARLMSLAFDHFGAISLMNEAWEEDRGLLRSGLYGLSFPREFQSLVKKMAAKQGLDSALILGLIKQESSFRPDAVSPANAVGLMQIVPITARDSAQYTNYKKKLSLPEDLFSPELNIMFGTSYLRRMIRAFDGHLLLALGSYNLGIGRLRKWMAFREDLAKLSLRGSADPFDDLWIDELPWIETSFYVKAVMRNFLIYRVLESRELVISQSIWEGAIQ